MVKKLGRKATSQGVPQKLLLVLGGPHMVPWAHRSPHPKWHLDWVSSFITALSYVKQTIHTGTHTQTTEHRQQ